jgi:hypothetical protein
MNYLKKVYGIMKNTNQKTQNTESPLNRETNSDFIDVKNLISQLSVEELCLAAEEYLPD